VNAEVPSADLLIRRLMLAGQALTVVNASPAGKVLSVRVNAILGAVVQAAYMLAFSRL